MPPEFIYFDLGNVLLHFCHQRAARQMSEVAGISTEQVWKTVFETDLLWRSERGEISSQEFWRAFCDETSVQADQRRLLTAMSDIFELNALIIPLVATLSSAGHRLGILSNTNAAHWEFVTDGRYTLLDRYFELSVLSFEERSMKPDPDIYAAAIRRCGVSSPERIFFVDDRPENVAGARRAGIDAVQYTTPQKLAGELVTRGVEFNY
jgi:putative hydrolase of the HAD superfamily